MDLLYIEQNGVSEVVMVQKRGNTVSFKTSKLIVG